MSLNVDAVLRYWRTSLADGASGEGKFSRNDLSRFVELSTEAIRKGTLPAEAVRRLFENAPKAKVVGVRLWPLVVARKLSHGATNGDGLPELVAPVVTEATLDREGTIRPTRNAIARNLLAPLPADDFSIGTVDALDAFLTAEPLPSGSAQDWAAYLTHCRKMMDAVARGWPDGDPHYVPAGFALIESADDPSATVRNIIDLYDKILSDHPTAPLLHTLVSPVTRHQSASNPEWQLARRLGHSNPDFPLAEQQRQVLSWLDNSAHGDVIAVNGPPGTGKTTLLLSAVAGLWVRAALEGGLPPVIVAASSNNQAVTNIIDAFGKDFADGDGPFAGRWLPGVDSFGLFLPAHSKRQEAAEKYQTEEFQTRMETEDGFRKAKEAWLRSARVAFPEIDGEVTDYVVALQRMIARKVAGLVEADRSLERLDAAIEACRPLGHDHDAALISARACFEAMTASEQALVGSRRSFDRQQAEESSLTALFSFLPAVERKRVLRARAALEGLEAIERLSRVSEIDAHLTSALETARTERSAARKMLATATKLVETLEAARHARTNALLLLGQEEGDQNGLEDRIDRGVRFDLFRLATHYWEGRWLLALEADIAGISASATKRGRATIVPRWHRRMMLTPCAVSTFASLPSKLSYTRRDGGEWASEFLYDFVDLLIIDEAGQVLPEVAGAAFALAKRALVIGDVKQLEPITTLSDAIDLGNLSEAGLTGAGSKIEDLDEAGIRGVSGSVMRLAQRACKVSPWPELDPGLWLFEHRRCHDEIIEFSNALCYRGKLRPRRGAAPADAILPALGYVHVDGKSVRTGGSRSNATEARTIAAWIDRDRKALEARYGRPIEQIVGIVTPFGAQVRELKSACTAQRITVSGPVGITIGTVHALQGAERPVVVFSPVYSMHSDGTFIDAFPGMLNVTVSRAKDSFLLFGDMDLLASAAPGSPRALLSKFLDRPGQELDFQPLPRADLQDDPKRLRSLRDADQHDAFLIDALSGVGRSYLIVSPWIKLDTMERTGILAALGKAAERGAKIDIYADPLLNAERTPAGLSRIDEAARALEALGIPLHRLEKLHSKIVAMDENVLCVGSFNWLSADRYGQYARHETSFIYSGDGVSDEIQAARRGLRRRGT